MAEYLNTVAVLKAKIINQVDLVRVLLAKRTLHMNHTNQATKTDRMNKVQLNKKVVTGVTIIKQVYLRILGVKTTLRL